MSEEGRFNLFDSRFTLHLSRFTRHVSLNKGDIMPKLDFTLNGKPASVEVRPNEFLAEVLR